MQARSNPHREPTNEKRNERYQLLLVHYVLLSTVVESLPCSSQTSTVKPLKPLILLITAFLLPFKLKLEI